MKRHAWLGLVLLASGCAPDDIARANCRSVMMAAYQPWECTLSGERIARANRIDFDTESKNRIAKVKFTIQVAKGTLRVRYNDLEGTKRILVTPQAPASVEMQTRMHPDDRSFNLFFEPLGGDVEGLTGTVDYLTP